MRIDKRFEIAARVGFGNGEESIVQSDFRVDGVRRADPVDCAFDFAIGSRAAGFALKIGTATKLGHVAGVILDHFIALDDVSVFQSHLATRSQPEIFRWRSFHEIVAVDEKLAAEWNFACPGICIFRIVDGIQFFDLIFGIIRRAQL